MITPWSMFSDLLTVLSKPHMVLRVKPRLTIYKASALPTGLPLQPKNILACFLKTRFQKCNIAGLKLIQSCVISYHCCFKITKTKWTNIQVFCAVESIEFCYYYEDKEGSDLFSHLFPFLSHHHIYQSYIIHYSLISSSSAHMSTCRRHRS